MALCALTPASMMLALLSLTAIAQSTPGPVGAVMPARASARILTGARVHLGPSSTARLVKASVHIEDGQRRPALLVEFQ
jgi:hypothetical protein